MIRWCLAQSCPTRIFSSFPLSELLPYTKEAQELRSG